jgi:hypothetical protein
VRRRAGRRPEPREAHGTSRLARTALAAGFGVTLAFASSESAGAPAPKAKTAAARPPSAAPASAARPVFTGRWKLDVARSEFGKLPGQPVARTDVIEHRDSSIVQTLYLVLPSGPDTTIYRYRPGGAPTTNRVGQQDITSRVTWDTGALHLLSRTKLLVFDMSLDEHWSLAHPDTLIMTRHVTFPMGEGDQRLVFVRQPSR